LQEKVGQYHMYKSISLCLIIALLTSAEGRVPALNSLRANVSLNQYYYNYSERLDETTLSMLGSHEYQGTPKSDEYGPTTLLNIGVTLFSRSQRMFSNAFIEIGSGSHTYDGATQNTTIAGTDTVVIFEPITAKKSNEFINSGLFAGPCFTINNCFIGFLTGLEYHYWNRKLSPVKEKYRWLYLPLMAQTKYQLNSSTSIGCNLSFMLMLSGSMQIDFGSYESMMGEMDLPLLKLGRKHGFSVELPAHIKMTQIFGMELKPWFEYRPSGISNIDTMKINDGIEEQKGPFLEPASESYSIGMYLSITLNSFFRDSEAIRQKIR
jgi:hypothetical protein